MLGKLLKYEFKNTAKVMLTIYLVVIAVSILNAITLNLDITSTHTSTFMSVIEFSFLLLYVLTLFALFIVTYIYVCYHFYKTMYSDQGYLTHTLPVGPLTTFHAKLLTAFIWMTCSIALLILSIFLLLAVVTHGGIFSSANWQLFITELETEFNISFGLFLAYMLIGILLSIVHALLIIYASASVGQLSNTNKVAFSIVAGIIFYFAEQLISTVVLLIFGLHFFHPVMITEAGTNTTYTESMSFLSVLNTGLIITVIFAAIYYVISTVIIKKHINLD